MKLCITSTTTPVAALGEAPPPQQQQKNSGRVNGGKKECSSGRRRRVSCFSHVALKKTIHTSHDTALQSQSHFHPKPPTINNKKYRVFFKAHFPFLPTKLSSFNAWEWVLHVLRHFQVLKTRI